MDDRNNETSGDTTSTPMATIPSTVLGDMGSARAHQNFITVATIMFFLLFVLAVIGNSLVIYIVLRFRSMRNSVTNFYIMNVALCDLLFVIICLPPTAHLYLTQAWVFGDFLCPTVQFLQTTSVQATCTTLTVMTVDRYYVILAPLTSRQTRTIKLASATCLIVWIASLVMHTPVYTIFQNVNASDVAVCTAPNLYRARAYITYVLCTTYVIPLAIITVCYGLILSHLWKISRGASNSETAIQTGTKKWKTTRIVLIVILLFALCWLPIHVYNIWAYFFDHDISSSSMLVPSIHFGSLFLAYSNSAINPFVYALAGTSFKAHLKKLKIPAFSRHDEKKSSRYTTMTTNYSINRADPNRSDPSAMSNNSTHF